MQVETRDIEKLISKWECLSYRLNHFEPGTPLKFKVEVSNQMDTIRKELEATGLRLDYFGWWE